MAGSPDRISPQVLYRLLGSAHAPLLVDLRRPTAFDGDDGLVAAAIRRLQSLGLVALADGLSDDVADDRAMLAAGMFVCNALSS
jgi:hypothetical protein